MRNAFYKAALAASLKIKMAKFSLTLTDPEPVEVGYAKSIEFNVTENTSIDQIIAFAKELSEGGIHWDKVDEQFDSKLRIFGSALLEELS